jgi:hypothetical protein
MAQHEKRSARSFRGKSQSLACSKVINSGLAPEFNNDDGHRGASRCVEPCLQRVLGVADAHKRHCAG